MEKHDVRKLLEQIIGLYPNIKLSKDTAGIWAECLQDISYEQARKNLKEHVKSNRFPPTIADIRGVRKRSTDEEYCEVTGRPYEIFTLPWRMN